MTELDNLIKAAQAVDYAYQSREQDDSGRTVIPMFALEKAMKALRQAVEQAKGVKPVAFCLKSRSRDEQIGLALKYWAKDVHFKNKHELIDALLGLCVTDGIGGDGVVLWKPAKDAINGILNPTPPSIDALIADAIEKHDEKMTVIKTVNTRKIAKPYVDAEREACAKVADDWNKTRPETNYGHCIANEIRARGNE